MATPIQHNEGFDEFRPPKKSNTGKFILVGCLSIVIAGMLLGGIGGFYVWQNWRGWASTAFVATVDTALVEMHMPAEEAAAILERVELLATEFEEKRVSLEELTQLGEAMTESELMPMLLSKAMYGGYIAPSDLSDEDKARGEVAFGVLARGFVDDKLVDDDFEDVLQPLGKSGQYSIQLGSDEDSSTNFEMRTPQQVSSEDLLEVIERAELLAAEKELDPEPLDVDIVAELDRLFEEVLGRPLVEGG